MIDLISDSEFSTHLLNNKLDNRDYSHLLNEEQFRIPLSKYLLLTYYPEKFSLNSPLSIYYNKYYWFLKFLRVYKSFKGFDAGIEQLEFKILQEGEQYDDIDWSVIEEISNENI